MIEFVSIVWVTNIEIEADLVETGLVELEIAETSVEVGQRQGQFWWTRDVEFGDRCFVDFKFCCINAILELRWRL